MEEPIKFFMPMDPPTITHQEKKVHVVNGKPIFYEPAELKAARAKLTANLAKHKPEQRLDGPLVLYVSWGFRSNGPTRWKISKPDTDNLQKLLKDCMTRVGFWRDDAQVCMETVIKILDETPGIYIELAQMEDEVYDDI